MNFNLTRDYANLSMSDTVETVIRDSKIQGTVTLPLRTEGYHTCCNLLYTERLK